MRDDWKRFSLATLLLCLVAGFAISPPEYHLRPSAGKRVRNARAPRLDDHEHDHALAIADHGFDASGSHSGDNPTFQSLLPPGVLTWPTALVPFGKVLAPSFVLPSETSASLSSGRSPPSC